MYSIKNNQKGFSYIEILVVSGIVGILLSFTYVSLLSLAPRTSSATTLESVVADIKHQQLKAISGDTDGDASVENFGVHFDTNKYTLFRGSSYSPSDSRNFVINLEEGIEFSPIVFPNGNLIFQKGSGEIVAYSQSNSSVSLRNSATLQTKIIQINQLGTIASVN